MEPKNIIEAFFQVLDNQGFLFDAETTQELSAIKQTLKELEDKPLSEAARAVVEWCKQHPSVRDYVLFRTKEISQVSAGDEVSQEMTLINQFPDWEKHIENRQSSPESQPPASPESKPETKPNES